MRKIKIGFSYSTKKFSPFSKALKLWDNVDYSHVYFEFENGRHPDIPLIYQASSTMLNFMSKEVFLSKNIIVKEFELEIEEEIYNNIMRDCMKSAGKPYGVMQILGIALADIFKLRKNYLANGEKYVCSEWVAIQVQKLGYSFDKELNLLKPIDIYQILERHKNSDMCKEVL